MIDETGYHYLIPLIAGSRLWINENDRLFWADRSRRVRAWRDYAHYEAKSRNLPMLMLARIVVDLHFADRRRRDPANFMPTVKACVDGLVDAGLFPDDDSTHVIGPMINVGAVVGKQLRGLDLRIYPEGRSHVAPGSNRRTLRHLRSPRPKADPGRLDGDLLQGRGPQLRPDSSTGMPGGIQADRGA